MQAIYKSCEDDRCLVAAKLNEKQIKLLYVLVERSFIIEQMVMAIATSEYFWITFIKDLTGFMIGFGTLDSSSLYHNLL